MKTSSPILAGLLLLVGCWAGTPAAANLVADGNFTSVTYTGAKPLTTLFGEFGTGTGSTLTVANWATTGYNFVFAPGTADTGTQASGANTGAPNQAPGQYNAANGYGNTYIWGPNNGSANGLPANSPGGGNFIAADGDTTIRGAITQSISGLTVGTVYALSFYWGAVQQQGFTGATTESWTAQFGAASQTTTTYNLPSHGFSGWMAQTFNFTATAATQTLSFLANGTPNGMPPFLLLGNVNLQVAPEFSNWMVFAGFGLVCLAGERVRRRRHRVEHARLAE